jgi:hypothetical protein
MGICYCCIRRNAVVTTFSVLSICVYNQIFTPPLLVLFKDITAEFWLNIWCVYQYCLWQLKYLKLSLLKQAKKKPPWLLVRKRTIPTERPEPLANLVPIFSGSRGFAWSAQQFRTAVSFGFLDRRWYFFIQAVPQLSSRVTADPIPYPVLLWKSGNPTRDLRICSQDVWPLDHRGLNFTNFDFFFLWQIYSIPISVRTDRLCGLVVRVRGCRLRGPRFDSRRYQIFWVAASWA